jgi:hypothetical protein
VTIKLTPLPEGNQLSSVYWPVLSRVDAVDPDGSFDQMITARALRYKMEITGELSHLMLDPSQDPTIDLGVPTADVSASTKATYC